MTPMINRKPGAMDSDFGPIHFVGIGGMGMSGIAEILHNLGVTVTGSDITSAEDSPTLARLTALGIPIAHGHNPRNLETAQGAAKVVVISTAVPTDNPEVSAARRALIPIVHRSDMLAELMRLRNAVAVAGSHGKTTTTSLIAQILDHSGYDPTVIIGGVVNAWQSNARLGSSDWMIVEADESDGSFERLPSSVAVVTNCDPEHMEFWGSKERLWKAFNDFVHRVPFYGFAVLCLDHPEVRKIAQSTTDRRILTYGLSPQAEVRAENITATALGMRFDLVVALHEATRETLSGTPRRRTGVHLPLFGKHNVQNALAAFAVAEGLGLSLDKACEALSNFAGVKRRFTRVGEVSGTLLIDDYGHHPVEIRAALAAARELSRGKVFAVVQPHRYSRLASLMDEFCTAFDDADRVFVTPVYPAGEKSIAGIDAQALVTNLHRHGHRSTQLTHEPEGLYRQLAEEIQQGDIVLFLGAGDITNWATGAPARLAHFKDVEAA